MDIAKPNLPKIASPLQFVKEVAAELKKVTWPTRAETIKLTTVVIALSVIVGAFIGGLDAGLVKLTSLVFKK
ncbi:preprotein translocase subunit SecE [Candidatus Gottesmanbacteria bacterium]|nr:preprotein translocase subunit SecE [Candidatus Gottesmanbacteria bacterium]